MRRTLAGIVLVIATVVVSAAVAQIGLAPWQPRLGRGFCVGNSIPTNIYYFGWEDTGTTGNPEAWATGNSSYRPAWARQSVDVWDFGVTDPPAHLISTLPFTPCTNPCWVHFQTIQFVGGTSTSADMQMVRFLDSGVARLLVRGTGTAGQLKVSKRTSGGTITDLATGTAGCFFAGGGLQAADVFVNYAVAGKIEVYWNGTLCVSFTGDVTTESATSFNTVELHGATGFLDQYFSEVIIADASTIGPCVGVNTLIPQAAGNTQSWTPNTLANINKMVISDGTMISSTGATQKSQWTTQTAPPVISGTVGAVSIEARLRAATTPSNATRSMRIGGADFTPGSVAALTTSFANYRQQTVLSPATGGPWVNGEVYASGGNQFNIGIINDAINQDMSKLVGFAVHF